MGQEGSDLALEQRLTFALLRSPRTTIFVFIHKIGANLLNECGCCGLTNSSVQAYLAIPAYIPASLFMPLVFATTQDTPQIPQINLSFPSFTHPHFAAATASIAAGLVAYVVSLYVKRRERNDDVDEGRYSEAVEGAERTESGGACADLNGIDLRVFVAARFRIETR